MKKRHVPLAEIVDDRVDQLAKMRVDPRRFGFLDLPPGQPAARRRLPRGATIDGKNRAEGLSPVVVDQQTVVEVVGQDPAAYRRIGGMGVRLRLVHLRAGGVLGRQPSEVEPGRLQKTGAAG